MNQTAGNGRSELLSVVAWLQIVGAGFGLLVSLLLFGMAWVIGATAAGPQAASLWPVFGVGCLFLASAALLLLAGLGLRRRYHWARGLSVVLCYLGAFLSVAFFVLEYLAADRLFAAPPGSAGHDTVVMAGTVVKTFLGGVSLASTALLVWVGNRLGGARVLAEFSRQPASDRES